MEAVILLQLSAEGRVDLDDSVRRYLPGYLAGNGGVLVDVNVQGGLPASMTSTTAELGRFISGVFDGRLLRPSQAAELFRCRRA